MADLMFELLTDRARTKDGEKKALGYSNLYRARIRGGWLVVIEQADGCGVTFVPDPDHGWNGGSPAL